MVEPMAASVLDTLAERMAAASWGGADLAAGPPRGQVDVRARGDAVARVAACLRIESLPVPNRVVTTPIGDCIWLGPDEWLWVGSPADRASFLETLQDAVGPDDGAAVDVSASRVAIEIQGPSARDVLASCCALDLHPRVFGPGKCAQTLIAKAPVLLVQRDGTPTYRLLVRPSLASYVALWLIDGMDGARTEPPKNEKAV